MKKATVKKLTKEEVREINYTIVRIEKDIEDYRKLNDVETLKSLIEWKKSLWRKLAANEEA